MRVCVRFFAQLRDLTRAETLEINLPDGAGVVDLLGEVYVRFPGLRAHDQSILIGAGVEFVDRNYKLKDKEEIAIMPPVQGG